MPLFAGITELFELRRNLEFVGRVFEWFPKQGFYSNDKSQQWGHCLPCFP